jgi:hypothetical protein
MPTGGRSGEISTEPGETALEEIAARKKSDEPNAGGSESKSLHFIALGGSVHRVGGTGAIFTTGIKPRGVFGTAFGLR